MNEFVNYLKSVKSRTGITSSAQLAIRLGVSQAHISGIERGAGWPSDELCLKLAALAGDDPAKVLLIAHKAKSGDLARPVWEKIIKALSAAALVFVLFLPIAWGQLSHNTASVYYVKLIAIGVLLIYARPVPKSQAA